MKKIQILIVDEIVDSAKSLGNIISDIFGEKAASIELTFNAQDGLQLIQKNIFHFAFLRVNYSYENVVETKFQFQNTSLNPYVNIINFSFQGESTFDKHAKETGKAEFSNKDIIDINEFVLTLETMKNNESKSLQL